MTCMLRALQSIHEVCGECFAWLSLHTSGNGMWCKGTAFLTIVNCVLVHFFLCS